jgi:hypothetical protein
MCIAANRRIWEKEKKWKYGDARLSHYSLFLLFLSFSSKRWCSSNLPLPPSPLPPSSLSVVLFVSISTSSQSIDVLCFSQAWVVARERGEKLTPRDATLTNTRFWYSSSPPLPPSFRSICFTSDNKSLDRYKFNSLCALVQTRLWKGHSLQPTISAQTRQKTKFHSETKFKPEKFEIWNSHRSRSPSTISHRDSFRPT